MTRVLVSAHRCNTLEQVEHAIAVGADYVEFDVQRRADGTYVVAHDPPLEDDPPGLPLYAVLAAIAGRSRAHLDLKFASADGAPELDVVRWAHDVLGTDDLLVTTHEDVAVGAIVRWSRDHAPGLLVGLSLGRSVRGLPWWRQVLVRISEVWPRVRYTRAGATLVVCKDVLARLGVGAFARRRGLPLVVWTVDSPRGLGYWLRPGRCFLVTTNEPELALKLR